MTNEIQSGKLIDNSITVVCKNCGDIHTVYVTDEDIEEYSEVFGMCSNCNCDYIVELDEVDGSIEYEIHFD
jgi:transcription elongation factor Elf1